jgi:hypothetical protein
MDRTRHYKPDTNVYYGPQDFYVGAVIKLREQNFVLLDCDKKTLQLQRELGCSPPDYARVEAEYRLRLFLSPDKTKIRTAFVRAGGDVITIQKLKTVLDNLNLGPSILEYQALCYVWGDGGEGEGGKGDQANIEVKQFLESVEHGRSILSGEEFRTHAPVPVETINLQKSTSDKKPAERTRELGTTISKVTTAPGGTGQLKNTLQATTSVSVQPSNKNNVEQTVTTRGGIGNSFKPPKPSPADNVSIPHSTGLE